jgi:hypothetical protein
MNPNPSIIRILCLRLGIYLAAVGLTYVLATVSATQHVVAQLGSMGIDVGLADRLVMTLSDLAGMATMFLPLIAFALLAAFLVAALIVYWAGRWRIALYVLAGATAMLTLHLTLHLAFSLTPIAIARSGAGLFVQALAGAAGGYLYVRLRGRTAVND